MTEQLIPAPLNQKDILVDALFDELFEIVPGYIENDDTVLGFINAVPVAVKWQFDSHIIDIYIDKRLVDDLDAATECVHYRLEDLNADTDSQSYCEISEQRGRGKITVSFFYRPETE